MADTRNEWRTERRGERADSGWLDDRGVSEVIGSILVFGLLVSLLAIVQTQAVPNANNEVEVQHSNDVQGDMANLQAAITRSAMFGGTESTVVETGMTYPPRLVLYNPPAVQGTLTASEAPASPNAQIAGFTSPNPDTAAFIVTNPTYTTSVASYRVDYNRYNNAPTIRFEHTALVNDFGDEATVEARGNLVNGKRINLVFLRDDLQASGVRSSSVTTYPVSAPGQTVDIETQSGPGLVILPTNLDDEVWVSKVLNDQIDTNALQGDEITGCDSLNKGGSDATTNPDQSDERYIVDCEYTEISDGPNQLRLFFQSGSSYNLRTAKLGFSASAEAPTETYVTEVPNANPGSFTVEVRDKYNNQIGRPIQVEVRTSQGQQTMTTDSSGQLTVNGVTGPANVFLTTGPNAYTPGSGPNCANSPGCAIATGSTPLTRSAVTVTDVGANPSNGEYAVGFFNEKDSDAEIDQIQLDYATQREQRTLTLSADALVGTITGDEQEFSASFVSDGPDSIQSVTVDGTTYEPVNPSGSPTGAKENLAPVQFREGGNADGDPVTLAGNSGTAATFTLNEAFSLEDSDSMDIAITVYYEDGSQATYTRTLFNNAGEEGQSPPSS